MSDQGLREHSQLLGSVLQYQFDFSPWLAARQLEAETAVSNIQYGDNVVTVVEERLQAGLWVGDIRADQVGVATIEVTLTPETGNLIRKRRFVIKVTDPEA